MNADYEIDYTAKTLPYLLWMEKRWQALFGVTILSDKKLTAEYKRIQDAIAAKKAAGSKKLPGA
jgi:hypothetical protein